MRGPRHDGLGGSLAQALRSATLRTRDIWLSVPAPLAPNCPAIPGRGQTEHLSSFAHGWYRVLPRRGEDHRQR